ncbi:6-hydroxymethylpterin diphosphokinase MptE-like protein [Chengkuizengella sp. SCS-71B]|uniref:6-hydroxymethylpterin diphosphokinase MptE-like protein n=1 Tax=Chengkuizengella sp. SCS-71B TaxID=3115290 RepID=UPI0032C21C33
MNKLKRIIKTNLLLKDFYKLLSILKNKTIINFVFHLKMILRSRGICDLKYKKLKEFKNIHSGKRCFIVATGPSLTIEDIEKLKNEDTFSMNSIVLLFDKTEWRPTYYGIQDPYVYDRIKTDLENVDVKYKFFGHRLYEKSKLPEDSYVFPHNILNHKINHKPYNSKFSGDIFLQVYDGYTITYSLIQIAVYMGYKEIYLIGADTNYIKEKQHIVEHGVVDSSYAQAGTRMIEAYKVAKKYADENGIKIYNATRGGMLEVFPRVDIDEVVGLREKN